MDELTGTIAFLIDHKSPGFLNYRNEDGEIQSIFFSSFVRRFKPRSSIWFKGDKVSFYIEQNEEEKRCARITRYLGNELIESLHKRLTEPNSYIINGYLNMHDDKVYFTEQETGVYFRISNLPPLGLHLDHKKLYEAYYDPSVSTRSVTLLEAEKIKAQLDAAKQAHQTVKTTVCQVNTDNIFVSIFDSCVVGIVETPITEHSYRRGDELNLYYGGYRNGMPKLLKSEE